jgi:hypothetical protein
VQNRRFFLGFFVVFVCFFQCQEKNAELGQGLMGDPGEPNQPQKDSEQGWRDHDPSLLVSLDIVFGTLRKNSQIPLTLTQQLSK